MDTFSSIPKDLFPLKSFGFSAEVLGWVQGWVAGSRPVGDTA